jgi:hypothetical protein
LSDRGDVCAFSGARGISAILEKAGCDHVKAIAQAEATFSIDNTKDPSAEATLIGRAYEGMSFITFVRKLLYPKRYNALKDEGP